MELFKKHKLLSSLSASFLTLIVSSTCLQAMDAGEAPPSFSWQAPEGHLEKYPLNTQGIKALIDAANEGDEEAQDEIVRRWELELVCFNVKQKLPNFLSWSNIEDRIINRYGYARVFFRFFGWKDWLLTPQGEKIKTALQKAAASGNMRAKLACEYESWSEDTFSDENWIQELESGKAVSEIVSAEIQYILGNRGLERIHSLSVTELTADQKKELSRSLDLLEEAAEKGYVKAQCKLGYAYHHYFLYKIEKNSQLAMKWLKRAASQGHAESSFLLGKIHSSKWRCSEFLDESLANEWYARAAEQGHLNALLRMGMRFYKGKGVEQDFKKAFEILDGLKNEFHRAKYTLAKMYYKDQGISDHGIAFQYFKELAINKKLYYKLNKKPDYYLSCMYYQGDGVDKDFVEGLRWASRSGDNGLYRKVLGNFNIVDSEESSEKCPLSEERLRAVLALFHSEQRVDPVGVEEKELSAEGKLTAEEFEKCLQTMVQKHAAQATLHNPEAQSKEAPYAVATLGKRFKILADFEKLCLETRDLLVEDEKKEPKDRKINLEKCFLTVLSPNDAMREHISRQQEPHFVSLDTVEGIEYLTFGEDNCAFAKRIMSILNGFEEFLETWGSLKESYLRATYEMEPRLIRIHEEISVTEANETKRLAKLKGKLNSANKVAENLEKHVRSFKEQEPVIEDCKLFYGDIVSNSRGNASARNTAFLEELVGE